MRAMQSRRLGSAAVPVLGIGTWKMEHDDHASAIAAIRRAVELGMTHVDTAELYGSGRVETLVGEALVGLRDRVFLVSKVLPGNASYEGTLRACEQSLQRLRTDHLDCYLLHWREDKPIADTFRAFSPGPTPSAPRSCAAAPLRVASGETHAGNAPSALPAGFEKLDAP